MGSLSAMEARVAPKVNKFVFSITGNTPTVDLYVFNNTIIFQ